jgi:hypothetical protein
MNTNITEIKNEIINSELLSATASAPSTLDAGPATSDSPSDQSKIANHNSKIELPLEHLSEKPPIYPVVVQSLLSLVKARKGFSSSPPLSHSVKPSADDPNFILADPERGLTKQALKKITIPSAASIPPFTNHHRNRNPISMTNELQASAPSFSFSPREKAGMRGNTTRENKCGIESRQNQTPKLANQPGRLRSRWPRLAPKNEAEIIPPPKLPLSCRTVLPGSHSVGISLQSKRSAKEIAPPISLLKAQ